MKNVVKNLIIFLILIMCQNSFCYTLTSDNLNKIVYNKINSEAKTYLGNMEYKINIQNVFYDVNTNEQNAPKVEISELKEFTPISYRRLTIKDSKGNIVKTIPLNVKISIYQDVLVANDNISFNSEVNSSNTKIEKKEISKYLNNIITTLPQNSISSKNILKGNLILKNSIKQKAIIEKNQTVDIVFQGKGIQVALKGKALKEGAMGDKILVRSEKYNKTYFATVNSSSKVTVRI